MKSASDGLRKLRRHVWHLVEHVALEWGDIDHALVGPSGAYAIETTATYLYGKWNPAEPDERFAGRFSRRRRRRNGSISS